MRWDVFEKRMKERFATVRHPGATGSVRVAASPVDACEALLPAVETEDDRALLEDFGGCYIMEVYEKAYARLRVFTFLWDDGGRMGWESYLSAIELSDGDLLLYYDAEAVPIEFFALVEARAGSDAWSAFTIELFGTNGKAYGREGFLGLLPPAIENVFSDVVGPEAIKEGFRRFLDRGLGSHRGDPERAWRRLRDEVIGRALATRSFSGYRRLPDAEPGQGADPPADAPLGEEDRRRILDNYFDRAYRDPLGELLGEG